MYLVVFQLLFFVSLFLLLHSYVLFPWLLFCFYTKKKLNYLAYATKDLPKIYIILSAYNEEKVIAEKLASVQATTYPPHKWELHVGSDNSTDRTNEIIASHAASDSRIRFFPFNTRQGKAGVLNKLVAQLRASHDLTGSIFIFTDANVIFDTNTLYELVKYFADKRVGQVGSAVLNRAMRKDGISNQEQLYIQRENKIKFLEGVAGGVMQGAFGACYAIRAELMPVIPSHCLMEDFYISAHVLQQRAHAILNNEAISYEDVSNEVGEEFKRKTRISAGNFQNLSVYWKLLLRFDFNAYCFASHKVIRWLGPLWLAFICLSLLGLFPVHFFYQCCTAAMFIFLATPILDWLCKKVHFHFPLLRLSSYFLQMNIALAVGAWKFLRGVESSVWNPTKRNIA